MAEIFYGADADLARLQGLTIAVIGYGIQGRAQALNMRDSGVKNVAAGKRPRRELEAGREAASGGAGYRLRRGGEWSLNHWLRPG